MWSWFKRKEKPLLEQINDLSGMASGVAGQLKKIPLSPEQQYEIRYAASEKRITEVLQLATERHEELRTKLEDLSRTNGLILEGQAEQTRLQAKFNYIFEEAVKGGAERNELTRVALAALRGTVDATNAIATSDHMILAAMLKMAHELKRAPRPKKGKRKR